MKKTTSGFTIIELLVVILVVAIIATLSGISLTNVQKKTRDTERSNKTTILAEHLEKYYQQNGEYPGCDMVTADPNTIATDTLVGIDKDIFKAPGSPNENSVICEDISEQPDIYNVFAYVGEGSEACSSNGYCSKFTIMYRLEADGQLKTIDSRNQTILSPEEPAAPILNPPTVTYSSVTTSSIAFGWTTVTNALRYESQYRTNEGDWSSITNENTSTSRTHSASTQGTKIEIRVRTVNQDGIAGDWSSIVGTTLTISTPNWNSVGRSSSFPNFQTWSYNSGGSALCPSGNSIYSRFRDGIDGSSWNSWGAWGSNGSSSSTLSYASTLNSFSQTLKTEIEGYCRNSASGAVSSTISTGTTTAQHTPPTVVLSGPTYCAGTYSNRAAFQLRLGLQETSYNLEANTSNVNWTLYRYAAQSGWQSFDQTKTWPWGVTINGVSWSGSSNSSAWRYSASVVGQTETISSGSLTVTHNVDGTKTISYSGYDGTSSNKSNIFGIGSCSGSYVLSKLR